MEEQDIRAACLREAEDHDFFTKVRAAATARSEQMEWRRQQARSCRDEREREREKSLRPKGGELTALEVRLWKEHEEEWDKLAKRLQSMRYALRVYIVPFFFLSLLVLPWCSGDTVHLLMGTCFQPNSLPPYSVAAC